MEEVFNINEPFVGGASGYCQSSFQPCGGSLKSTSWVVEDTCTALAGNRRALQIEGSQLVGLDENVCPDSVRRLTSRWSGRLVFETVFATDERRRARRFDLELTPACFTATFGVEPSVEAASALCSSLNVSEDTTCLPVGAGCRCSALTMDSEEASGVYDVVGNRVSIWADSSAATYDYCVQGNRLLWGKPGTNQHIVLRQRDSAGAVPAPDPDQPH